MNRDDFTPAFLDIEKAIRSMSETEILKQYAEICKIIDMHKATEKSEKNEN